MTAFSVGAAPCRRFPWGAGTASVTLMSATRPVCIRYTFDLRPCTREPVDWPSITGCPPPLPACWLHLTRTERSQYLATWDVVRLDPKADVDADRRGRVEAELVAQAQRDWPDVGEPWSQKNDEQMLRAWEAGTSAAVLAVMFDRSPEQVLGRIGFFAGVDLPDRNDDDTADLLRMLRQEVEANLATLALVRQRPELIVSAGPTVAEQLERAGVPQPLRARPWLELAMLVECGTCMAVPEAACTGAEAVDAGRGVVVCSARLEEIPEVTAGRCARQGCSGSQVDRPLGWTEHCWAHSDEKVRSALYVERLEVSDGRESKMMLEVDIEASEDFWCAQCRAEPGVECRGRLLPVRGQGAKLGTPGTEMSHHARIKQARSHRRARQAIEAVEPSLPFL